MLRCFAWSAVAGAMLLASNPTLAQEVTVQLNVVEIDSNGERPAGNTLVLVLPKNQGIAKGYTDTSGNIAFRFDSAESVTFRVGKINESVKLQPLSGRISQSTSCILDRRETLFQSCECAFGGSAVANSVLRLLNDIESVSGGRLMDDQSREYVKELREEVLRMTTPPPNADEFLIEECAEDRALLLEKIDSLLSAPWRMRASYESRPAGALITELDPNGPAAQAGLQIGDVVTHINSIPVATTEHSFAWLIANSDSDFVELQVLNNSVVRTVQVSLTK